MKRLTRQPRIITFIVSLLCGLSTPLAVSATDTGQMEKEVKEAIALFEKQDPGMEKFFRTAHGYAVFPSVTKGAIGIGAAHGSGLVYEKGRLVGQAGLTQVTIGAQLGGQSYSEVIFFETEGALESFKGGNFALSAQASAVAAASGASTTAKYELGVAVFTLAKTGLMYEASVGGQKFSFTPVGADSRGGIESHPVGSVKAANGEKKEATSPVPPSAGTASKPPSIPDTVAAPPPEAARTASGLMSYFAGEYYSYTSGSTMYGSAGTERTVTLCPDGRYRDSYEFSASGTGEPAWGGVNSQKGAARWTIQGDKTRGVLIVTYAGGKTKKIPFQVVSKDEGTILFDGITFAFAGAPKCP